MRYIKCIAAFFLINATAFAASNPSVAIVNGDIYVTTPHGKKQVIPASDIALTKDAVIRFEDVTFSGKKDLVILNTMGANQKFYDVYLYSRKKDEFIYNKKLSEIPCIAVDAVKKQIVGQCFHISACENWSESYSITPSGHISLVERKGTYCDPSSGQGYSYIDQFQNGKRVFSKTTILPTERPDE
jgi:hypothetical protein